MRAYQGNPQLNAERARLRGADDFVHELPETAAM
jgi:hypothetical protein